MHILKKQTQLSNTDLKAIAVYEDILCISSFDNKIHIFDLPTNEKHEIQTESNVSSLCIIHTFLVFDNKSANPNKNKFLMCAGLQNGLILVYIICKTNHFTVAPPIYLTGHQKNVCSLQIQNNILLSTSWDNSVKMWDLQTNRLVRSYEYSCCVWSAHFFSTQNINNFVAANADKTLRIVVNDFDTKITPHLAAVRHLKIEKNIIYTIGNDGKIMKLTKSGKIVGIKDVKEFIYKMDIKDNKIIVCGENGSVFLLDLDLNLLETISINTQSVWGCVFYHESFYLCGSNGYLYEYIPKSNVKECESTYSNVKDFESTINNAKECESTMNNVKECESISTMNNEEGCESTNTSSNVYSKNNSRSNDDDSNSTVNKNNYKVENGKVYYNENGLWNLIGDVIEDNKQYDHTFDVEVDKKCLKINFNKNDNIYDVADKFLNDNQLNKNYKDDIVEFIKKNFKPKESFFVYDDINLKGVRTLLDDDFVLENLKNPDIQNNEVLEIILKDKLKEENNYVILDCYRFFVSRGFTFDFLFLQDYDTGNKKNGTAFLRLVVNLYSNQPFNLEILKDKINMIIDFKMADNGTINNYKRNQFLATSK